MNRRTRVHGVIVALTCIGMSGCFFSRKPKAVQVPNPPAPAPAQAPAPAPSPAPASSTKKAGVAPRRRVEAPPQPAPDAAPAPAPAASPAQLGQILTPAEKAQLTQSLDQSMSAARAVLARVAGRSLARDQTDTVNLIKALLTQAEAARGSDLSVAAQLARRAELLARDLSSSVR